MLINSVVYRPLTLESGLVITFSITNIYTNFPLGNPETMDFIGNLIYVFNSIKDLLHSKTTNFNEIL